MKKNIISLNAGNFNNFVKNGISIIDFWAEWCGPCKIMNPIFEDAFNELKEKANFGKVDIESNQELAQRFQIMSIPTTIFFKNGEQVDRSSGILEKEEIIKRVKDIK